MPSPSHSFIEFILQQEILQIGNFTLKSGRQSHYFFNLGLIKSGKSLSELGFYYAQTLINTPMKYDILFGPAYKGIPLVTSTVIALNHFFHQDVAYAFNRKEIKDHGEGGQIVGAPLKGKVLIVDDVITAGTAIKESVQIIQQHGAEPAGVLIALDRQELDSNGKFAIQSIMEEFNLPVYSITNLQAVKEFIAKTPDFHHLKF